MRLESSQEQLKSRTGETGGGGEEEERKEEEEEDIDVCMGREKERNAECLLYCFIIRTEENALFSPPACHDTVADKSRSACTMGGFGMVVNLIDKAKQWHNACRPITFLFV